MDSVGSAQDHQKDSGPYSTTIIASSCWFRTTIACWPPSFASFGSAKPCTSTPALACDSLGQGRNQLVCLILHPKVAATVAKASNLAY